MSRGLTPARLQTEAARGGLEGHAGQVSRIALHEPPLRQRAPGDGYQQSVVLESVHACMDPCVCVRACVCVCVCVSMHASHYASMCVRAARFRTATRACLQRQVMCVGA